MNTLLADSNDQLILLRVRWFCRNLRYSGRWPRIWEARVKCGVWGAGCKEVPTCKVRGDTPQFTDANTPRTSAAVHTAVQCRAYQWTAVLF